MASPPIDTFELETAAGQLVFDFDVFRGKDVRILVDGREVARMPAPTAESPREEIKLTLEGHPLLAVTEARNRGSLMVYDLFHEDRSLKNGAGLDQSRAATPAPSTRRPAAHGVVEAIIHITTTAGATGVGVGLLRGAERQGWPATVLMMATGIAALWLGTAGARVLWSAVLRQRRWSERRQSIVGIAGVSAALVIAIGAWVVLLLMVIRRPGLEF